MLSATERRAAIALAEAMIPGSEHVRPADENLVGHVVHIAHDLAPPLVHIFAKLAVFVENAAVARVGRRFSELSVEEQQHLLDRWYEDPVMRGPLNGFAMGCKFMHFDAARGFTYGPRLNPVPKLEPLAYARQIHDGDAWPDDDVECDVVVVGTGAGGAVVGKELADRDLAVVFVEEGQHWRRDSVSGGSIDAHRKYYRGALVLGPWIMPVFMGRMFGGSTAVNTGSCYRTPRWILDEWCERLGTDELAEDRMAPYFDRVERTLGVEVPDRKRIGPAADVVERGCKAFGWANGPVLRNAPGCEGAGFCDFGCPTDARRSTNLSYMPPALRKGAVCVTGLRVDEILIESGRAVGVSGVTRRGRRVRVRARAVVLAGGAIPTPALLARQGLCNTSGELGRNLSLHPSGGMGGLMPETIRGPKQMPQGWHVSEFLRQNLLITAAQSDENFSALTFSYYGRRLMNVLEGFDRICAFGIVIRDTAQQGRLLRTAYGHTLIKYAPTQDDVKTLHMGMVHTGELLLAAGATALYPAVMGVRPIATRADFERFRRMTPSANRMMGVAYHPLGTVRMGRDPKKSVVGLDHQAHDLPGLFVADGSTVPGPPGVNPQITIMAMATRASAFIAEAVGTSAALPREVRSRVARSVAEEPLQAGGALAK